MDLQNIPDQFESHAHYVSLTNILDRVETPFVFTLNSPWGTGKTFFIGKWEEYLNSHQYKTFTYNAWEHDFTGDPLVSFVSELKRYLKANNDKTISDKELVEIGKAALIGALVGFIKAMTSGMIDPAQIVDDALDDQGYFKRYESVKGIIHSLKTNLEAVVKKITNDNGETRPFIIFIDELDRCRPDYAIELLESIKHLFDIPGIIFILAIDKSQLEHSVKKLYGSETESQGYLSKFFDLEYSLPIKNNLVSYCNYLFDHFHLSERLGQIHAHHHNPGGITGEDVNKCFLVISLLFRLSLRDIQKLYFRFSLVAMIGYRPHLFDPYFIIFFLGLKLKNQEFYYDYFNGNVSAKEILNYVHKLNENLRVYEKRFPLRHIISKMHIISKYLNESDEFIKLNKRNAESAAGSNKIEKKDAQIVMGLVNSLSQEIFGSSINDYSDIIYKQIEDTSNFQ